MKSFFEKLKNSNDLKTKKKCKITPKGEKLKQSVKLRKNV